MRNRFAQPSHAYYQFIGGFQMNQYPFLTHVFVSDSCPHVGNALVGGACEVAMKNWWVIWIFGCWYVLPGVAWFCLLEECV